jgi:dual specificity tyrosine-phosphorylation-regulated kinase 2/3/4
LKDEIAELSGFPEVYYVGTIESKVNAYSEGTLNFSRFVPTCHIQYRYEVLRLHSRDHYGQNLVCIDHKQGCEVMLKAVFPSPELAAWADSFVDKSSHLPETPYIAKVLSSFRFRNYIFIEFESTGDSFFDYLQKIQFWEMEDHPVLFPPIEKDKMRKIARELLLGLRDLHSHGFFHGKLAAHSILQHEGAFQIFGFNFDTRFQLLPYRSPETLMGLTCGPPTDIWSLGCLLAELVMRRVPFTGNTERELFSSIADVLGPVPKAMMAQSNRRRELMGTKGIILRDPCLQLPGPMHLAGATQLLLLSTDSRRYEDSLFVDFVKRCLEWWPQKRMTAEEALRHPWIGNTERGAWKRMTDTLPNLTLRL